MNLRIIVLAITAALAIAGWLAPETTPTWLRIGAVILLSISLVVEGLLEIKAGNENATLRSQIADLHAESTRTPAFQLSLNSEDVKEGTVLRLARVAGGYPLEFSLRNIGAQTATNVQVHLLAPDILDVRQLGKHWLAQGTPSTRNDEGYVELNGVTQFSFIAPVPIHPEDWLRLGKGLLRGPPPGMQQVPMRLKVSTEGGEKAAWNFRVAFPWAEA